MGVPSTSTPFSQALTRRFGSTLSSFSDLTLLCSFLAYAARALVMTTLPLWFPLLPAPSPCPWRLVCPCALPPAAAGTDLMTSDSALRLRPSWRRRITGPAGLLLWVLRAAGGFAATTRGTSAELVACLLPSSSSLARVVSDLVLEMDSSVGWPVEVVTIVGQELFGEAASRARRGLAVAGPGEGAGDCCLGLLLEVVDELLRG